jgi:hypothetical protein
MNVRIIPINLTKDCGPVLDHFSAPKQEASSHALDIFGKGQLSARSETDGQILAF